MCIRDRRFYARRRACALPLLSRFRATDLLSFTGVEDCCLERFFVKETSYTSSSCPPSFANRRYSTCQLLLSKSPCRPSLQLVTNGLTMIVGRRRNNVNMVATTVDLVERPTAMMTMIAYCLLDDGSLKLIQSHRLLGEFSSHHCSRNGRPCLLYTSPSPRDATLSRMPSSA